jgi:methylated-DNA-[protein]-cysteine S-methyltransferase
MTAETATRIRYHVFDTAIGACGIAWGERGVMRFALPGADRAATERRLKPGAEATDPPPAIAQVVADVRRYAQGEHVEFAAVAVDFGALGAFQRQVLETIRALGWGKTSTYGEIARRLGADPRDVGEALSQNPVPLIVPCHRIVASDGTLGGFSAPGGRQTKARLLALEGFGADAPRLPGL